MKFSRFFNIALAAVCVLAAGCKGGGGGATATSANSSALVVFSQASKTGPWRAMYEAEMADAAKRHASDFQFKEEIASDDAAKQISQIQDAVTSKAKVLMVSPVSESVFPAMEAARKAGVYVILLDYFVKDNSPADAYCGANLYDVGVGSASYMAVQLKHKGTVLILDGPANTLIDKQRVDGFKTFINLKFARGMHMVDIDGGGSESGAKSAVAAYLKAGKPVDGIFAADDDMALGASEAVKDAKSPISEIEGTGACQKTVMDALKSGTILATFTEPPGGPKAMDLTPDLLNGHMPAKETMIPCDQVDASSVDNFSKRSQFLQP